MGLVETEGVVLRSYNLAEADRIIVLFTREAGLVRGVARGARRLKSRFSGALEPFTTISVQFAEKEGRDLVTLRTVDIRDSVFFLASQEDVGATVAKMAALLQQFAPPHEPNETLYRMIAACVAALRMDATQSGALARYFEVWLLKLSGFLPDVKRCAGCRGRFEMADSACFDSDLLLLCGECGRKAALQTGFFRLRGLLDALLKSPLEFMKIYSEYDKRECESLETITRKYIERTLAAGNGFIARESN
jgi:DNA repair protein RecO (recombination protein O)